MQTAPACSSVPSGTVGDLKQKAITPDGVYKLVPKYTALLGFEIRVHTLRGTAATKHSVMRRIAGLLLPAASLVVLGCASGPQVPYVPRDPLLRKLPLYFYPAVTSNGSPPGAARHTCIVPPRFER